MTIPIASLLVAVLMSQPSADRMALGTVADEQGKPIAGVKVVLFAPPSIYSDGDPVEGKGLSDGDGKFSFKVPTLHRLFTNSVHVWAYWPGLAIAGVQYEVFKPHQIVLRKPERRTLKVVGPDGEPVVGARVEARVIYFAGRTAGALVPDSLGSLLAATTGMDGTATVTFLRDRDRLVVARVRAEAIGEQDLVVTEETLQGSTSPAFVIKLKKTGRLAGRIVDEAGQGVANQVVEIWSQGGAGRVTPNLVEFSNGPLRTGADGTFQTPDNLIIGSSYRVAAREPGKEPGSSDWTQISEKPVSVAPVELRALRTVTGWTIDRNGTTLPNVEIFQSGNGVARTAVKTDANGRFALGGIPDRPGFLFARADGFRFGALMMKPGDHDIAFRLSRTSERPEQELRKLADPIPIDEARSMALRILERWWKAAVDKHNEGAKFFVIQFMIPADPVGALKKIENVKFPTEKSRARLLSLAARALARTDFEEGETVAESIADPGVRAGTLARLSDLLPESEKARKLAILERALLQAKAASPPSNHVYQLGEVAARLLELGETSRAKEIFAEGLGEAKQFRDTSANRRSFAALLARVDVPGAMELAKQLAGEPLFGERIISSIAFGLPWDKPEEADRFLNEYASRPGRFWLTPVNVWKIATQDPVRAAQLVATCRDQPNYFEYELCLALGAKGRDETMKTAAIQSGLAALDRAVRDEPHALMQDGGGCLAIAEAIDPALVAEVMWRAIAARPLTGNPRALRPYIPARLAEHIAWYDRGLAAALLEPALKGINKAENRELIDRDAEFELWTLVDPRAAVARLEKIPMTSVDPNDNRLWIYAIEKLALDVEQRWRRTFSSQVPIFNPANRDFTIDRF